MVACASELQPDTLSVGEIELLRELLIRDPADPVRVSQFRARTIERLAPLGPGRTLDRLIGLGLVVKTDPQGPGEPDGYRIPNTPEGFDQLVGTYLKALPEKIGEGWRYAGHSFLDSAVSRAQLSEGWVRRRLGQRAVSIHYLVDPKSGSPKLSDYGLRVGGWRIPPSRGGVLLEFPIRSSGAMPIVRCERSAQATDGAPLRGDILDEVTQRHYREFESRMLVEPILGLVRVSPSALSTFAGAWQPADPERVEGETGVATVDHLIFRMVFDAIGDLSYTRSVPDLSGVLRAAVRPERTVAQRHDAPLLELFRTDGAVIGFEAGFDTDHEYYQGEDDPPDSVYERERNPENCWVRIWWDRRPPWWKEIGFESKIGYSFEDRSLLDRVLSEASAPGLKNRRPSFLKQAAWLGDTILGSYITLELLRRRSSGSAHELNSKRQVLSSNANFSAIARRLGLKVEVDWPRSPGPRRDDEEVGMLADSFEAIVGAAYMDGGLKAAEAVARLTLSDSIAQSERQVE